MLYYIPTLKLFQINIKRAITQLSQKPKWFRQVNSVLTNRCSSRALS